MRLAGGACGNDQASGARRSPVGTLVALLGNCKLFDLSGCQTKKGCSILWGVKWDNVCGSPCSPVDLAPCVSPDRGRGSQGTTQLSPAGLTGVNLCSPPASSLYSLAGPPTLRGTQGSQSTRRLPGYNNQCSSRTRQSNPSLI